MPTVTYAVRDIDSAGRNWLENALGQPLRDNQQVSISMVGSDQEQEREGGVWEEFDRIAAKAEAHIREQGITDEEVDAAIEEAIQHVRYGRS